MKTCIRGGTILLEQDEFTGDVLIENGVILKVAPCVEERADVVIDASGRYVLAGGVDEHTHFGSFQSMSFETCVAAAAGGTTTVMDFVAQQKGESLKEALDHQIAQARGNRFVNIGFHSMLMDMTKRTLDEINMLPSYGIHAVKLFMAYKGTPYYADTMLIKQAMLRAKQAGVLIMLHAEDADMIQHETEILLSEGQTAPYAHALAHPPESEVKAVQQAIELVKQTQAPLFLVHISTKEALTLIEQAQIEGLPIACETCTHYLVLQKDVLRHPTLYGCRFICSPPLRSFVDQNALWNGIHTGVVEAVSSDHCAVKGGYAKKTHAYTDFSKVANGVPGVQNRLHMLWTYGVCEGKITRQELVRIFSANPADRCHLTHKGRLQPGYDADIVMYDPRPIRVWKEEDSLEGIDYATFAGMKLQGMVEMVWINGQVCVQHERVNKLQCGQLLIKSL